MQYLYYGFFFLISFVCITYIQRNKDKWDIKQTCLYVFAFCFMLGLYLCFRDINSDFVDYRAYYIELQRYGEARGYSRVHEFLYQQFQFLCIKLGFSYPFVYLFNIILMLFPIILAACYSQTLKKILVPFTLFYLLTNLVGIGGTLRQMIAIALVFAGLLIVKRNIYYSILLIVIAGLFHRSGLLLLVFVPILKYLKTPSLKYQLIVYVVCFILASTVVKHIDKYVAIVATVLGHGYYQTIDMRSTMVGKVETGTLLIGFQLVIITLYYNLIKRRLGTARDFEIVYNMFFIGSCFWIIISQINADSPLARANYFGYYSAVGYALAFYVLKKDNSLVSQGLFFLLVLLQIWTFIRHIAVPFYPGLMPLQFVNHL